MLAEIPVHQTKVDSVGEGGWPVVTLGEHLFLDIPYQLCMTLLPIVRMEAYEVLQGHENLATGDIFSLKNPHRFMLLGTSMGSLGTDQILFKPWKKKIINTYLYSSNILRI